MNITELLEGEYGVVDSCSQRRLLEHGLVPDTKIYIYKKYSDMTCICVRGAVIACRNNDLKDITVKHEDYAQEKYV